MRAMSHKALARLLDELAARLTALPIEVTTAPFGYSEIDDIGGVPDFPVYFEEAVVLCARDVPQHQFKAETSRWSKSKRPRTRRYFRVNRQHLLSEVFEDGRYTDMTRHATADEVVRIITQLYGNCEFREPRNAKGGRGDGKARSTNDHGR